MRRHAVLVVLQSVLLLLHPHLGLKDLLSEVGPLGLLLRQVQLPPLTLHLLHALLGIAVVSGKNWQ